MASLTGKTALITGGSRGLGRAICLRLAQDGASIIVHYNENRAAAEDTAAAIGGDVRIEKADLSSADDIEALFARLSDTRLDILVNNAGVWRTTPLGESVAATVDELLDTNIRGPFLVTQAALPLINEGGRIVNVSSVAGRIAVAGGRGLYGATKAAIDSLTKSWALELAPRRILVNAVAPGYVVTDMTAKFLGEPDTLKRVMSAQPLGRLGLPEDIADAVAFLCSDGAKFISGQSLNISGAAIL